MLYPLYVRHDEGSAWCGEFPDIQGCFTAADELQDLPAAAQEAVAAHFGADNDPLPAPTSPEHWSGYQGGFWLLVDIDLERVRPARSVRLNISLPQPLLMQIDACALQRGQSRSAFLASAAVNAIQAA